MRLSSRFKLIKMFRMLIILISVIAADIVPVEEWNLPLSEKSSAVTVVSPTTMTDVSPKILKTTKSTKAENCECPEVKIGKVT